MLSILVPVYNYNVYPRWFQSCTINVLGIAFEILCQDDASNLFKVKTRKINSLENCNFSVNNLNLGRGKTSIFRQKIKI
jgi:hypothetical protein